MGTFFSACQSKPLPQTLEESTPPESKGTANGHTRNNSNCTKLTSLSENPDTSAQILAGLMRLCVLWNKLVPLHGIAFRTYNNLRSWHHAAPCSSEKPTDNSLYTVWAFTDDKSVRMNWSEAQHQTSQRMPKLYYIWISHNTSVETPSLLIWRLQRWYSLIECREVHSPYVCVSERITPLYTLILKAMSAFGQWILLLSAVITPSSVRFHGVLCSAGHIYPTEV